MKSAPLETLIDDYQQLIEAIGDAIVVADPDGAISLWNPAAERLFGFTPAEALGNSLDLIIIRSRRTQGRANLVDCLHGRVALWVPTRGERNRSRDPRRNHSVR